MRQAEEEAIKEAEQAALEASEEVPSLESSDSNSVEEVTTSSDTVTGVDVTEPKTNYMLVIFVSGIVVLIGAVLGIILVKKRKK